MKQITTWLNEAQYKRYMKRLDKLGLKPYGHLKNLVLIDLGDEERDRVIRTSIIFAFTLYSLFASVITLVF